MVIEGTAIACLALQSLSPMVTWMWLEISLAVMLPPIPTVGELRVEPAPRSESRITIFQPSWGSIFTSIVISIDGPTCLSHVS